MVIKFHCWNWNSNSIQDKFSATTKVTITMDNFGTICKDHKRKFWKTIKIVTAAANFGIGVSGNHNGKFQLN